MGAVWAAVESGGTDTSTNNVVSPDSVFTADTICDSHDWSPVTNAGGMSPIS